MTSTVRTAKKKAKSTSGSLQKKTASNADRSLLRGKRKVKKQKPTRKVITKKDLHEKALRLQMASEIIQQICYDFREHEVYSPTYKMWFRLRHSLGKIVINHYDSKLQIEGLLRMISRI